MVWNHAGNQEWRMRTFLIACGLLVVVVGVGVLIGLEASAPEPGRPNEAQPLSDEPQVVGEKMIPAAEARPRLNLPAPPVPARIVQLWNSPQTKWSSSTLQPLRV